MYDETVINFGPYKGHLLKRVFKEHRDWFLKIVRDNPQALQGDESFAAMVDYYKKIVEYYQGKGNNQSAASAPMERPNMQFANPQAQMNEFETEPGTEEPAADGSRYIPQIGVIKHSNMDKSVVTTLATDASIRQKCFNDKTVSPLMSLDDKSRFHLILIDKKKGAETVVRKAGINPKLIRLLNARYDACVQTEVRLAMGDTSIAKGTRYELLNQQYLYMKEGQDGKRHYDTQINFTLGQNNPFYIGISNVLENNRGEKKSLGRYYINLTTAEMGNLLSEMTDYLNLFRSNVFKDALANAKAGGYRDSLKFNN